MKSTKRFLAILVAAAACALPARGYDNVVTHTNMTVFATQKSVLYQDGTIMFNLGLLPADKERFIYTDRFWWFFRWGTAVYDTAGIVGEGSFDEDSDTTVRHHFFDPHFDRALTPADHRSWEWALEEPDTDAFQQWSLRDARRYLSRGLTAPGVSPVDGDRERTEAMRNMFLSLGHVVHHIQDMAQPQHARHDNHFEISGLNFPPFSWTMNPSRYEAYTMQPQPAERVRALAAEATPLDLSSGAFRIPRDFWFNPAHTGMAELTNRQFVSQGTNFAEGSPTTIGGFPLPTQGIGTEYTLQQLFDALPSPLDRTVPPELRDMCGTPAINCRMIMVATDTTQKASTFSIFDQDLKRNSITVQWGFPPVLTRALYSVNRFNFDTAHEVLIKRAVSYSAGFLNHFFRGKLEVLRPATGAYAVVDHGTSDGFREIRARVKNATPNEALSGGTLRAIAKFHRNNCYQPDLTGEFRLDEGGTLIEPCPDYRSVESHLRMTASQDATFDVGETKEMTFTFSEPIPFNATDLILQVYYEGIVGIELSGHALGAVDLSEPTYFTVMNATDVFEINAQGFWYPDEIIAGIQRAESPFTLIDRDANRQYNPPPDIDIRGGNIAYEIFLDEKKFGDVLLPEGRFARIAALVSPFGAQFTLIARGNGFNDIDSYVQGAKHFQYDPSQNAVIVSVVDFLRNHTLQYNSVSYYHFYPTTGAPLEDMPASRAASATVAITVEPSP